MTDVVRGFLLQLLHPMGPQQFNLPVGETFQTRDPAAPGTGVIISATVGITINWNNAHTELTDKGVEFDPPQWAETGCGPLTVYSSWGDLPPPIGRVSWSIDTHLLTKTETDTPNKRYRWAITPVVQLHRQVTMTDGTPSSSVVAYTASDTVRGDWINQ